MDNRYKVRLIDSALYDPWSPSGPAPNPETIAHGLSHLCRYSGHVKRFYSVAEHSLWIALNLACDGSDNDLFRDAANTIAAGECTNAFNICQPDRARVALLGLCHDAAEACGLVDLPSPIGAHEEMAPYKQAHVRCTDWLCKEWGVEQSEELHKRVKAVDYAILGAEIAIRPIDAETRDGNGEQVPPWPNLDLATQHDLSMLGTKYVRRAWLSAYATLKGMVR